MLAGGEAGPGNAQAAEILTDGGFQRAQDFAIGALTKRIEHPKIEAFLDQCRKLHAIGQQGLVFTGNVYLADILTQRLRSQGLRTDTLTGPHGLNAVAHAHVAAEFLQKKLDFVICTSVAEGRDVCSDLKTSAIICYTPPVTKGSKKAREQRGWEQKLLYEIQMVSQRSPDCTFYVLRKKLMKKLQPKLPLPCAPQQLLLEI